METSSLQIYSFHEVTKQITPVYDLTNKDGLNLRRPESICISKDETLIAIPNMRSGKLQIYGTKEDTFINPVPRITIKSRKLHGAGFSPDGKSISFTGFGEPAGVYTASLMRLGEQLHTSPIQFLLNQYEPLKPKSVAFSPDGRFAAIGYCIQLSREEGPPGRAILAIYHRDPETGWIDPSPISKVEDLFSAETVAFYPDGSCIFVVDQLENRITAHVFDKETGELGESWIALENPEAELNFCHGIAITADGKYVAITNYGDDKITVYERKSDGRF
jgi:6-phosphogluconolactonase (cycloisomerase 2 family)